MARSRLASIVWSIAVTRDSAANWQRLTPNVDILLHQAKPAPALLSSTQQTTLIWMHHHHLLGISSFVTHGNRQNISSKARGTIRLTAWSSVIHHISIQASIWDREYSSSRYKPGSRRRHTLYSHPLFYFSGLGKWWSQLRGAFVHLGFEWENPQSADRWSRFSSHWKPLLCTTETPTS